METNAREYNNTDLQLISVSTTFNKTALLHCTVNAKQITQRFQINSLKYKNDGTVKSLCFFSSFRPMVQ